MGPVVIDSQLAVTMASVGVFAAVLSYFACRAALSLATSTGMIVLPGVRQSHSVATPTGGGLGLVFSLVITTLVIQPFMPLPGFWWLYMLPGVVVLAVAGWFDDRRHVSSLLRLFVQLAVTFWLLGFVCFQNPASNAGMCVVMMVAMIWLMNLYNFMDGSNGMAGFQGVFAGLVMAVLFLVNDQPAMALLALAVAAACAGFLPLNFPTARIFMGDVASVPLGFIFGSMAVYGLQSGAISLSLSVLIMSVFLVDATLTLVARVFAGERWYTAHNQHVYQQLITKGWSHSRVLLLYQSMNLVLVLPAIVLAALYTQYATVIACLTLILLGACWGSVNMKCGLRATRRLE